MSEGKVAIVTVHGTGDTADSADGAKWFQRGSEFSQRLLQHLSGQGVSSEIVPHLWTGANSAWDRERGANKLAARIRGLYNKYDTIHVIGHSHGGNVANDAAVRIDISADAFFGVYGPAGLPADVAARIDRAVADALRAPDVQERIVSFGLVPNHAGGAQLAATQAAHLARWEAPIKASGFKAE